MFCKVWKRNGKLMYVKNLGYLLRHWKEVVAFEVTGDYDKCRVHTEDPVLTAHFSPLSPIAKYECHWADITVLRAWLHRPVFIGVPLAWFGEAIEC